MHRKQSSTFCFSFSASETPIIRNRYIQGETKIFDEELFVPLSLQQLVCFRWIPTRAWRPFLQMSWLICTSKFPCSQNEIFFQKHYLDVVQTFEHHSNARQMKKWGGTEFRKLLAIKTGHNYFRAKSVSRSELKWPFFKKMSWTWN